MLVAVCWRPAALLVVLWKLAVNQKNARIFKNLSYIKIKLVLGVDSLDLVILIGFHLWMYSD